MDWITWFCAEDRTKLLDLFDELCGDRINQKTVNTFVRRVPGRPEPVSAVVLMRQEETVFPARTIACTILALMTQGNMLGIWDQFDARLTEWYGATIHPSRARSRDAQERFAAAGIEWCTAQKTNVSETKFINEARAFFR